MKHLKKWLPLLLIPAFFSACSKKEKTFEVQGTIVSRQTQLPIEGLEIGLTEHGNYYYDNDPNISNPYLTDSLGRFIVRLNSDQSKIHLLIHQKNGDTLSYTEQSPVTQVGLSTIETDFQQKTPIKFVFRKQNGVVKEFSFRMTVLSDSDFRESPISSNDFVYAYNSYRKEITFSDADYFEVDKTIFTLNANSYLKYEMEYLPIGNNQDQPYVKTDSIYIPYSSSLITDTIYF